MAAPNPIPPLDPALVDWFLSKVRKTETCWLWNAGKFSLKSGKPGYGAVSINRRTLKAHRVAWTLLVGPIPDGLWVLHACDNPPCVRPGPGHLFLGTHADNMADMARKGRGMLGDLNVLRRCPEKRTTGDRHWTRLHPEKLTHGDDHWTRRNPERLHRGPRLFRGPNPMARKLDEDMVREIRASAEKNVVLAARYGVTDGVICRVRQGKAWRCVV